MLALHERLAIAEREKGPLTPWLRDNTIHKVPYDGRSRTVGGDEANEALADFYVATNDVAFDMTDAVRGGAPKLAPCFDLMVATAHAGELHPDDARSKCDGQYRAV